MAMGEGRDDRHLLLGSLSPALARLVHHYPSEVLLDLSSRHEVLKKAMEAKAIELSSHLAQARLRAEEVEQHLVELRKEANSQVDKLNLELVLALYRVEESEAWAEEAHDEAAIVEDMAAENIMKE
ncbi:hypothetical protein B296_00004533 [Ensete ventricosum]|uniref:Uncharacterized protein n=1 Tax=Ensete ventricosum TaxID=4639 RepID=A0A426YS26_ENSVE|nr:hypothetical protein B296_00004533 [Ensete ventricosum]